MAQYCDVEATVSRRRRNVVLDSEESEDHTYSSQESSIADDHKYDSSNSIYGGNDSKESPRAVPRPKKQGECERLSKKIQSSKVAVILNATFFGTILMLVNRP